MLRGFLTLGPDLLGLLRWALRRLSTLGILRAFQLPRERLLILGWKWRQLKMTVESYVQMLRNMKKGMRTVVIEGIRIQWFLESQHDEDV